MSLLSCSFLNAQSKDTILAKVFWYRNLRSFTWAIIKVLKTPGSVEQHCWMWFSVSAFQFSTRKFIRWKMEQLFGFSGNMNHVNKCMDSTALSCSVLIRWLMSDHVCLLFPSATLVWSDSLPPPMKLQAPPELPDLISLQPPWASTLTPPEKPVPRRNTNM